MSCDQLTNALSRISAQRNQVVDLNVDFYRAGQLADPFAIRKVEIYKTQIIPSNLIATVPVSDLPTDDAYPTPVCREYEATEAGACGTEPTSSTTPIVGKYHLPYTVPADSPVPDVYFDLWYYFADDPCGQLGTEGTECDIDDSLYDNLLLKCCHRFWIGPDNWFCDDNLQSIKFGFEPLDQRFNSPEIRPLEVGLMPLPLYDYNYSLYSSMIPFITGKITVETLNNELLLDNETCSIGIRQGSYRTNPWVVKYNIDTSLFLKGTYRYYITLTLPNGSTRVSPKFIFTIS